jgi:hypothetical protein
LGRLRTFGHVLHRRAVHDPIGARLVSIVIVGIGFVPAIGVARAIIGRGLLHGRALDHIFLELAVVLLQDGDPVRLGLG